MKRARATRELGAGGAHRHLAGLRGAGRLVEQDANARQLRESSFDHGSDPVPVEAAKAAAERGDGDAGDSEAADVRDESLEASFDVLVAGVGAPVAFGREIDDELGIEHGAQLKNVHAARLDLTGGARLPVGLEIVRIGFLELKRDALAHKPDAIDGVHQGFGFCLKNVAVSEFDHKHLHLLIIPPRPDVDHLSMGRIEFVHDGFDARLGGGVQDGDFLDQRPRAEFVD